MSSPVRPGAITIGEEATCQIQDAVFESDPELFGLCLDLFAKESEGIIQEDLQLDVLNVIERVTAIDGVSPVHLAAFEMLAPRCDTYLKAPVSADRATVCLINTLSHLENDYYHKKEVVSRILRCMYQIVENCSVPFPNNVRQHLVKCWKRLLGNEAIPFDNRLKFLFKLANSAFSEDMTWEDIDCISEVSIPLWIRCIDGEECSGKARLESYSSILLWSSKQNQQARPISALIDFQLSAIREITIFMDLVRAEGHIPESLNSKCSICALWILNTYRADEECNRFWGSFPTAHLTIMRFAQLMLAHKEVPGTKAFLKLTIEVLECFMDENPRAGMGIVENGGIALVFAVLTEGLSCFFTGLASFAKRLVISDSSHLPRQIASSAIVDLAARYEMMIHPLAGSPIWDEVVKGLLALGSAMIIHSPQMAAHFTDGTLSLNYVSLAKVTLSNPLSALIALQWLVNLSSCSQARHHLAEIPLELIYSPGRIVHADSPSREIFLVWKILCNMGKEAEYRNQLLDINFCEIASQYLGAEKIFRLTGQIVRPLLTKHILCCMINVSCKNLRMKQAFHQNQVCGNYVTILHVFVDHREVCELTLWAIFNLYHDCPPPPGTDLASLADSIMNAFNKWQQDVRVSTRACKAIWTICSSRKFSRRFFERLNAASTIRSCTAPEPIKKAALRLLSQ